jgi:hypothetical protein
MTAAIKQSYTEVIFKLTDAVGDGRGYTVQFLSRGSKTAATVNGIYNRYRIKS